MRLSLLCGIALATGLGAMAWGQANLPAPVVAAIADLARHLSIPAEQITVVHLEGVTWPDTSLGCPQPGMAYAQVLVEGYKVILEAANRRYEYHTDMVGRAVRVAEALGGTVTAPTTPPPPVVATAIADLSGRLGLAPEAITLVGCKEQMWTDGSLGLPEPGMVYTKAIVSGYYVVLGAGGREYEYHCSENAALLAGVRVAPEAVPTLLCLQRTEPLDGNNFYRLVRMDPNVGGQTTQIFPFLSSFAATPDGKSIAAVVRTSRSGHDLLILRAEGEPLKLDSAFDFGEVAWSPLGHKLAWYKRPGIVRRNWGLEVYDTISGQRQTLQVPVDGDWTPAGLAWTLDGLAFSVSAAGQEPRVMFWDGVGVRDTGETGQVLGWIPRTRCIYVKRAAGENTVALWSLRPTPGGQPLELLRARDVLSVAEVPGNLSALAVIQDQDRKLKLVQVSWGGGSKELMPVPGTDLGVVAVGPAPWLVTLSYVGPEDRVVEVLRLGEELMPLMKLSDCPVALPVMR